MYLTEHLNENIIIFFHLEKKAFEKDTISIIQIIYVCFKILSQGCPCAITFYAISGMFD